MKAEARRLARIIQANPLVSDEQRAELGITVRDTEPTPVPPPQESPLIEVVTVQGRLLRLKLRGVNSERRGKPDGVHGASVFSFVGNSPPADISLWKFESSTTRTVLDIEFPPATPAGSQVWLTAFWFNAKSQSGPACTPISTYLAGGVIGEAA